MSCVLVFGGKGQLGQALNHLVELQQANNTYLFLDHKEGNILEKDVINALISKYRPSYFVNCAAYTAVDLAENNQAEADAINHIGIRNLAECASEAGIVVIHISTDFVFDGRIAKPLTELDPVGPINVYGRTKLAGEKAAQAILKELFIIRTSWLYSEYGSNFLKTMLRLGKERNALGVVADQVGTPTYASDLAQFILDLIEGNRKEYGLYHYSNEGVASWYDFAYEIFDLAEIQIDLKAIRTEDFPTAAERPRYSVLNKSKIKNTWNVALPHWKSSLKKCMKNLKANK